MPTPFELHAVPRLIFGRGQSRRLGDLAATFGRSALVIYNGQRLGPRVAEILAAADVKSVLRRQRGEPVVDDVDAALDQARSAACTVVIGAGGGSAIDAAKAVAGLLANGGTVTDYMEVVGRGQKIIQPAAPWIALPTTAGTGAEATRNAVIGLHPIPPFSGVPKGPRPPTENFKASLRSEHLMARAAIIDPELAIDVPPDVTASSGMDALCQLIESYTSTGAQPITDALALRGIELAAGSLLRAYRDGHDLDAREDMALAAYLSGVTLTNAGLGAVHGFAAPLGANYPAPHGVICGALLPHVIAANLRAALGDLAQRYATIGRLLAGDTALNSVDAAHACIRITAEWVTQLKIPPLSTFGLTPDHVTEMVTLSRKASSMRFNPVTLSNEELARALNAAIQGNNTPQNQTEQRQNIFMSFS